MVSFTVLALALIYGTSTAFAERVGRGCGTSISASKKLAIEKHFTDHRKVAVDGLLKAPPISVYWNLIYTNETTEGGYLPDKFIDDQMQVLADDFARSRLTFAVQDVRRIYHPEWFSKLGPYDTIEMDTEMKTLYRQGGAADLNIFTVGFEVGEASGLLGYATLPADYEAFPIDDGVVLAHMSLPGGSIARYNLGRTLTHEVGHWVGLYHTFDGGCEAPGDEVKDTPPEESPAFGCPVGRDTCPGRGADPIHNFMDYSDDACMTHFTPGQIRRFKDQIATYRQI
ncbi:hypothetical protein NLJ89_g1178 [Agrocybe chaxingu]|uniref:Peptidase M43 pregnancy-associated plasma-A domain-containing protein n=1 Tax=Agrocybe chaxingu TaxID=84603 RepID=A0A9W8TDQ7_9AGAR|nr:hypothetical protein NLJ89_g1178 [Agrocybe chaxingu]